MNIRTIDTIKVDETASYTKTISESDVYLFAGITGDNNPSHINEVYAMESGFKGRVVHGMLTASLISAVLGMQLPGPGTVYLSQEVKFLKPVRIGDTITATVKVLDVDMEKSRVRLETQCKNQLNETVLDGIALVKAPK